MRQTWRLVVDLLLEMWRTLFGYDIFISYSHHDQAFASALHDSLKARYRVFFDVRSGTMGRPLAELLEASAKSRMVLVVLTSHSAASSWVAQEVNAHLQSPGLRRLAPVFADAGVFQRSEPVVATLKSFGGVRVDQGDLGRGTVDPSTITAVHGVFRKIRRTVLLRAGLVAAAGAALVAFAIVLRVTPDWAWATTDVTELNTIDAYAAPLPRPAGTTWALTGGYHRPGSDGGVSFQPLVELSPAGRITGCLGFARSEGGVAPDDGACGSLGPAGSLQALHNSLAEKWRSQFDAFDPWKELVGLARLVTPDPKVDAELSARAAATLEGAAAYQSKPVVRVRLRGAEQLAFVTFTSDQATRSVPLRSKDGRNWVAGAAVELDASGISGAAVASSADGALYLTTEDHTVPDEMYGLAGGLFRSADGGLTWQSVKVPEPWGTWRSFASVVAAHDSPGVVAVATSPVRVGAARLPRGVPGVIVTKDGGLHWELLTTGFRTEPTVHIDLVSVSASGRVVALLRQSAALHAPGRLVCWRELGLLERIRGTYGL